MKSLYKLTLILIIFITIVLLFMNTREDIKYPNAESAIPPVPDKIRTKVKLYFILNSELVEEERTIITKDMHIESEIIQELIKGPRNKTLISPIPKNTQVISAETIDGVCYLNLSKEFIKNSKWDTLGEPLIIWAIVNSLSQLDYVQRVQFLIEGKKVGFIGEDYSFEDPFIPNEELIKKNTDTPFGILTEFLNDILNERFDKAYTLLSKESKDNINFKNFKVTFSNYIKKLKSYDVFMYHTQQYNEYVKVTITYVYAGAEGVDYENKFKEDWKLLKEDGVWKIVLEK